jgi:hypothetical protein
LIATAGTQYEYNAGGERVSKDNAVGAPQTLICTTATATRLPS